MSYAGFGFSDDWGESTMTARERIGVAGLAGFVGMMISAADPPAQPSPPINAPNPFERLDLEFRDLYASARSATLAKFGPIVVVDRDALILIHEGRREVVAVIPPVFHQWKSIAHVPLSLEVALASCGNGPIDADRLCRLRSLRSRIEDLERALDDAGFSPERAAQAKTLVQRSAAFLDEVLASGRSDSSALNRVTREAGPIAMALVGDAARAEIDAYRSQLSTWRRVLNQDQWASLRVVVRGVAMPRRHNTAVQFFAKLLDLPGESPRLVYAEGLADEAQALDLLATHALDGELGRAFFADDSRMESDLLGNAAAAYLDTLDLTR